MTIRSINTSGLPQGVLTPMGDLLFAASEPGAWYDPSDLSTLFQDSAGTTPVTAVEQAVALMLDKSRGSVLGPELVTGGGFDGPANWTTSAWTVSAGVATYPDTINDFIRPANANLLPLVAGKTYCVRFTLSGVTGSATCAVTNADGSVAYTAITSFTTNGEKQFIIYAANSTTNIRFYGYTSSGGTWSLDNISVRELPGNHASQATSTKRPKYSRRVNLLTKTEQFDVTWTKQDCTITANATTAPNGTLTAGALIPSNGVSPYSGVFFAEATAAPKVFTFSVKKGSKRWAVILGYNGISNCWFDLDNGVVGTRGANYSASSIEPLGDGWYKVSATLSSEITGQINVGLYTSDTNNSTSCTGNGSTVGIYIWHPSVTLATDAHLPYQWVNTATDYDADPNKFPAFGVSDGVDDSFSCATGGGGNAGFFFSEVIKPLGSAGANRVLFSDAGTNTGYIVRLNTSNKLELAAGNSTAYTTIATAASLDVGARDVVQAWDDGTNLNVKIGAGPTASIARPVVVAGTAGFTLGQDNGASTGYFNGARFGAVYRKDSSPTQAQREAVATYQRMKAKMP